MILKDGSVINGVPGTNTLDILPGAELLSSGTAIVESVGAPGPFTINNNGTVVCNTGLLELSPSFMVSTNGTAKFQTVAATATIFIDPPTVFMCWPATASPVPWRPLTQSSTPRRSILTPGRCATL